MRIWRPVQEGFGTLREVQDLWSLDDLCDALLLIEAGDILKIEAAG
jgi:hypothetical protein